MVRTVAVVVMDVGLQHSLKVTAGKDEEPVKALRPDRSDPSLGETHLPSALGSGS